MGVQGGITRGNGRSRAPVWATILVLVLAVVPFATSATNGYAMDDEPLAASWSVKNPGRQDPVVGQLRSPGYYFDKFYWYSEYVNDGLYRPVTIYSYALVNELFGKRLGRGSEATPQHVLNILLHVFATFLVLMLLKRIGLGALASHVGAALFGVHAIHSEVVAGVVGRAELFAFCFGLWGILMFARAIRVTTALRYAMLAGSSILLFLAYASKESALACCPFLFCFVLATHWRRGGHDAASLRSSLALGAAVSILPLIVFFVLRHQVMSRWMRVDLIDYVSNPLYHADLVTRLSTAVKLLGYGLYKCVAPFHLSANYGPAVLDLATSPLDFGTMGAFVVLGAFLWFGIRYARRAPSLFLAMTAFLGFSFITSNIPIAIGTIFAERLYYAPSLGVCILAAVLVHRFPRDKIVLGVLGLWAIANIVVAFPRNAAWKDTETLFLTEAKNQPRSADMLVKAASALRKKLNAHPTNGVTALGYLEDAIELIDGYLGAGYPHALREKAALHGTLKDYDKAIEAYQAAIDTKYPELEDTKALAYNGLAAIHLRNGDHRRALEACKAAMRVAPNEPNAWLIIADIGHGLLPDEELRELFVKGATTLKRDPFAFGNLVIPPVMAMSLGVMGEKVGADPALVFEVLEYGVTKCPVDKRPGDLFAQSLVRMAQAKVRSGQVEVARTMFQKLLENPRLGAELRGMVEKGLAKLPAR